MVAWLEITARKLLKAYFEDKHLQLWRGPIRTSMEPQLSLLKVQKLTIALLVLISYPDIWRIKAP